MQMDAETILREALKLPISQQESIALQLEYHAGVYKILKK